MNFWNFCRLLIISSLHFMISQAYIISTTCVVCLICKFIISFFSFFCQSSSSSFSFIWNICSCIYFRLISIINSWYNWIIILNLNSIKLLCFIILCILFNVHFFSLKLINHMYINVSFFFHTIIFKCCWNNNINHK